MADGLLRMVVFSLCFLGAPIVAEPRLVRPIAFQEFYDPSVNAPGCWITLFNGADYGGARYTYFGPDKIASLWGFARDSRSVIVGPKATVRLYAAEAFADRALTLQPGEQVADLGFLPTFASMTIGCEP